MTVKLRAEREQATPWSILRILRIFVKFTLDHQCCPGLASRQSRLLSISFILLFSCSLGFCAEELGESQPTNSERLHHVYQTETGFMGRVIGSRSTRRSPVEGESEHGFLPLHQQQDAFIEDSRDYQEAVIWTDPDNHCSCWNSTDGGKAREVECKCNGTMRDLVSVLPSDVHRIVIKDGGNFTSLKKGDLRPYNSSLREITLSDLTHFREIRDGAFIGMRNLDTIYIVEMPSLTTLSKDVFKAYLPKLKIIRISHSSLTMVPNLSELTTANPLEMVDLENNKIAKIEQGWLGTIKVNYLALSYNKLEEIGPRVFHGSTISRLTLKGNRGLKTLHPETFSGITHLSELDLSETAITQLPTHGLKNIEKLILQNVITLTVIPSIYHFQHLKEAWMTFPYHCCAFAFPETHNPEEYANYKAFVKEMTIKCDGESSSVATETKSTDGFGTRRKRYVASSSASPPRLEDEFWSTGGQKYHEADSSQGAKLNENPFRHRRKSPLRITRSSNSSSGTTPIVPPGSNSYPEFDPFIFDPEKSFAPSLNPSKVERERTKVNTDTHSGDGGHGSGQRDESGVFHESVTIPPELNHLCGNVTIMKPPVVKCRPTPDAFSPCEDIMGNIWLRGAVWVVVTLALVGNTAVLVVLLLAPGRMSVQRFLMANLSWADLCMGIYLLMVATEDLVSLGAYFNHAISWQLGWGCQVAGFFTVFASELSVFTLAIITGERWYALTRAMHLTKRLTIINAAELMSFGWVCSIALAALPLLGVSSYSKTSICLPMEATTAKAQGYLLFLLVFNGLAFTLVACAYFQMYRAVAGHGNGSGGAPAAHSADAAIAKKMALLVFTDFACWAPVAFFGLTAVAGVPLIGVTDSKILLVFFYPLNACCNPYLYAILTKQYRRDLLLLLSRHGICTKRAARYKTGQTGSTNNTMHTMQTILRLGSVAETKAGNGGRISATSTGGQSSGSTSGLHNSKNASGNNSNSGHPGILHQDLQGRSQKISVCSIASISERDIEDDENGVHGRLLVETSFISLPGPASERDTSKTKHVRTSTGSSPDSASVLFKSRLDTVESFGEAEQEASERTPFCSP